MVRTAREHALSCIGMVIFFGVVGLLFLIFGPNIFQNPFIIVFLIVFLIFIMCWLFGYIHPNKWVKRKKKENYIKEAPSLQIQRVLQEELGSINKFPCPHCGALQDIGTKFCTKCGQKIETT